MTEGEPVEVEVVERDAPLDSEVPWQRLSARMIVVDLARSLLAIAPSIVAFVVFDLQASWGTVVPLAFIAVTGVVGAGADVMRWITTRYRITDDHVERSTGLFVKRYRSIRRDRIRSIDLDARLRHRLAGLKVVLVGAGQQSAAAQSALSLDAIVSGDAERLRSTLLRSSGPADDDGAEVFATFRLWWVVFHMVGIWALVTAGGLLWGGAWFLATFGVDIVALSGGLLDWDARGLAANIAIGFGLMAVVGAISSGIYYVVHYWRFELARAPGEASTSLRTRHGLLRTREVNRDETRTRGVMISEPLLWQWAGMSDTDVVTTGLSIWSSSTPSTILPRGPISVARPVAARVLGASPDPVQEPLTRHPRAALRRRLVWATMTVLAASALAGFASWAGDVPGWVPLAVLASWPVLLLLAYLAYGALGHAISGRYLVVRSGLISRRTVVLQRTAVSTIILRESLLQRRLGLRTVTVATAAGWGAYSAPDLTRDESVEFAAAAAPGLLDPFIETGR